MAQTHPATRNPARAVFASLIAIATLVGAGDTRPAQATDQKAAIDQLTCSPCRQNLESYGKAVYVTHEGQRAYVCCPGCAAKMQKDWKGYVDILTALGERLETVPAEQRAPQKPGAAPQITNLVGRAVCRPCMGGACQIKRHLPGFQPE